MEDRYDDTQEGSHPVYTDPNADVVPESEAGNDYSGQDDSYQDSSYQNEYDYNTGNTFSHTDNDNLGMDISPMSMGDWLITILVSMIPCAGIILYLVWAFGKTGNVNRRNFCRAQLIIMVCLSVLYLVLTAVFATAIMTVGIGL